MSFKSVREFVKTPEVGKYYDIFREAPGRFRAASITIPDVSIEGDSLIISFESVPHFGKNPEDGKYYEGWRSPAQLSAFKFFSGDY